MLWKRLFSCLVWGIRISFACLTPTLLTRLAGQSGFFTMEYVAGGNLEQFWQSHGVDFVPVETSVNLVMQIARGLAVAHSGDPPVVHRDVQTAEYAGGLRVGGP